MASVVSHPAIVLALAPWRSDMPSRRLVLWGVALSVAPDLDVIGFWLGVPYDSPFGHRGLTHSLFFALVLAAIVTAAVFRRSPSPIGVLAFLFLCAASHGLFDAMTDGGRGIALLAPFDGNRYFLPWRPIRVSPIGIGRFLGPRGLAILESELVAMWIPCAAVGALGLLVRGSRRRPHGNA